MTDTLINKDTDVLGGTPVFSGTRVPIRILIEHLEAGDRLDEFLDSYPTVSRSQAIRVLERAKTMLTGNSGEAAAGRIRSETAPLIFPRSIRDTHGPAHGLSW